MAVALTRILISACARHLPATPENTALLQRLWGEPLSQLAQNLESLEPLWDLFRQAKAPSLGQLVLGNMLNACLYRIRHPGEFALPHRYHARLGARFPLPIVLYDGRYFQGGGSDEMLQRGWPYPISAMETLHDLIGLMTMKPLERDAPGQCGFLEEAVDCWYIKSGLGCPLLGLNDEQIAIRQLTQLDDWCHWTLRSLLLRTAPDAVQHRWRERWARASAG
jgi:hypothetical protein